MTQGQTAVATSLDAGTWERINEAALWIHLQGDVAELQRGALDRVRALVPHKSSMFDLMERTADGSWSYVHPVTTTMSKETLDTYYARYAAMDYTTWSFDQSSVNVYRDLDLVDVQRRNASPIYQEWMRPQGVYYGCSATLAQDDVPLGSVTLFREREAGDFSPTEMRILLELARHLSVRLHDLFPAGVKERRSSGDVVEELVREHDMQPREAQVMRLMLGGLTNRQMAERLFISESTVKKHVNAVYRKLGVANRIQLARLVMGLGQE